MKLYFDPISTTSRPVLMFLAEHPLEVEFVKIDLMAGEHRSPEYLAINPNGIVPFLVDGDFRLGESAAILKYLAIRARSNAYPVSQSPQLKVDEAVSWFNTQFHEYFCLFTCYPNMGVPAGLAPELSQAIMAYGREHAPRWLKILDEHMLGAGPFVCGDRISLADYVGLSYVLLGKLAAYDFGPYPNITAWLARMQARPSFAETYGPFEQLAAFIGGQRQAA
jgi:glutathione S-transferase